jgi:WD40 repeat protein
VPDPAAVMTSGGEASPDGETLAVPQADGTVTLRDRRTGSPWSVLPTSQTGPIDAAWSPTGTVLATVSGADRAIVLWDVSDLHHPAELHRIINGRVLDYNFRTAGFSPDGRVVAVNDYPKSGRVTFLDVASGRVLRRVALGGQIGGLVYSPDGETIATIRYVEGTLLLLDAATGRIRATRDVTGWPLGADFVHGGRRIATLSPPHVGSLEGPIAIELWDATTLEPFGEPVTLAADGGLLSGASPDGMQFVIGTHAGYGVLLDLNPRHWEQIACRIAGRNLTRAEWDQYLPGREYRLTCVR